MTNYNVIVSRSGTRHIVGSPPGFRSVHAHAFRTTTLCGFGVKPEEALPLSQAVCDCPFCLAEAEGQRRKQGSDQAA
jgi:hypothetical protein